MAYSWNNLKTATLTVKKFGSGTEKYTFQGVSSDSNAGTPQNFLDAANHLLAFGGQMAVIDGIKRTVTQEGADE